jgi:hypothetical protein
MPAKSPIYSAALLTLFTTLVPPLTLPAPAATVTWAADSNGSWNVPSNWSSNPSLPGPNDDVIIDRGTANPIITLGAVSGGVASINSLVANETFRLAGTLTVGTMQVGSTFTLAGGTLRNANLTTTPGGSIVVGGSASFSTLDAIILNADATFGSADTTISDNLVLNGTAAIASSGRIEFPGTQTLTGVGTISLSGQGGTALIAGSALSPITSAVLTIGPGITIHGGANGTASAEIGSSTIYHGTLNTTLLNQGTINADATSAHISIYPDGTAATFINSGSLLATNGGQLNVNFLKSNSGLIAANNGIVNVSGTWTNSGTLALSGGTLNLGGTFSTKDLNVPTFSNIGGIVTISGSLDNTNTILPLNAQTGSFNLSGTLTGGTIATADGTPLLAQAGTISGTTIAGVVSIIDSSLAMANNLAFAGGTLLLSANSASSSLLVSNAQSITGTGTIAFTGSGGNVSGSGSLVLGPSITLTATSPGTLPVSTSTAGPISASVGGSLTFAGPSFSSTGPIQASSGGSINFGGGTVSVTSPITLNNALATFSALSSSISSITGPGTVTLSASRALTSDAITTTTLNLGDSSTLTLRSNTGPSKITQLIFNASTATLNINNNKFIVQANAINKPGVIAALNNDVLLGLSNNWLGPGLISGPAAADPTHYEVQLFDNAVLGLTTLNDQPVDANSLIVSLNHIGDANNNGVVDIQDQSLITNNWQHPASTPTKGDLDHDGFVDIQDLTLVTNNWQQSSSFTLSPDQLVTLSPSPIPEPATLAILLAPLLPSLRRRRAQNSRPNLKSNSQKDLHLTT